MTSPDSMTNRTKPTADPPLSMAVLFCIGLTGGIAAAVFPRMTALLATGNAPDIDLRFFTTGYMLIVVFFSLIIGLATVWMNWRSHKQEEPKAIFIAALSLPALISGGLSTTGQAVQSTETIRTLQSQIHDLQNQLKDVNDIPEIDLSFRTDPAEPVLLNLFISPTHAQPDTEDRREPRLQEQQQMLDLPSPDQSTRLNPAPVVQVPESQTNYLILYGQAASLESAAQQAETLTTQGLDNLSVLEAGGRYYIVDPKLKTKTDALLDAVKAKKQPALNPQLLRLPANTPLRSWDYQADVP